LLVRSAIAQLKEKALDVRKAMLRIPEATEVTWRVLRNGVQRSIQDLQKTYRDASRAMDTLFREPSARL
jgi:hypothetical protein